MHSIHRVLGFALLLVLCSGSLVMGTTAHHNCAVKPGAVPPAETDPFDEAVQSFQLLRSFFNDTEGDDVYPVSTHGRVYDQAYQYLLAGFESTMAEAILSAYTFTDTEGVLKIIPCEGIPYVTSLDRKQASITCESGRALIAASLHDCYQPGDGYKYTITSRLVNGHWKISDLALDPE